MLGGRNKQPKPSPGYTIVEVLIVLAVSGMMFVIAVNFINGKQAKAAFTQGTNEMASQIQGVIEQVANGQYSDIPVTCTSGGGNTNATASGASSSETDNKKTGINAPCVFLGKMLRFHQGGEPTYDVVSMAGARVPTTATGTVSPSQAAPTVINGLDRTQNIPQRLTVRSVRVSPGGNIYNFGFAQGLGSLADGSFTSGAQTISMIYSLSNMSAPTTPNANLKNGLNYARSATICMTDGQRYAQILVGGTGNSSTLSVRVKVVQTCS